MKKFFATLFFTRRPMTEKFPRGITTAIIKIGHGISGFMNRTARGNF